MKTQPSVSLTHAGYNVRIVLDRKGIAYPIWGGEDPVLLAKIQALIGKTKIKLVTGKLPSAQVRESFKDTLEKVARKMGAKGVVRI